MAFRACAYKHACTHIHTCTHTRAHKHIHMHTPVDGIKRGNMLILGNGLIELTKAKACLYYEFMTQPKIRQK